MLHGLGSGLWDARVKIHQILKFVHGVSTLWGTFPFAVSTEISKLFLHVLLHAEKTPVKTSCLVTYDRGLACRFLPPTQRFLGDASRRRRGRSQTGLAGYPTETAVDLWRLCTPAWDSSRVSFVVGGKTVLSGLWLRRPQEMVHQQATGLRTAGGTPLNQS